MIMRRSCWGTLGDVFNADRAYAAHWGKFRHAATITFGWLKILHGVGHSDVFEYANAMANLGVRPRGPSLPNRFRQEVRDSVGDGPLTIAGEVVGDLVKGRLVPIEIKSGAFTRTMADSKLPLATKPDVTSPDVMNTRHISDPRLEVNTGVANDNHPACIIHRRENIARRLLYCKRRYRNAQAHISKRGL